MTSWHSNASLAGARAAPHGIPLRVPEWTVGAALLISGAVVLGMLAAGHPELYRVMIAGAIGFNLIVLAARWPRTAVIAVLVLLPFVALIRRLLISDSGWTAYDPILMVAPTLALLLLWRMYALERRPLPHDRLGKLVLAFLALTLVQSLNPFAGSLLAGFGGLLFLGVPLLWFFIGRETGDRAMVMQLLYAMVGTAAVAGAYGLYQSEVGLPSWDFAWVNVTGYHSLYLSDTVRPFGTFSSSAEYAIYLGAATAVAAALLLHRRGAFVLALPALAVPLFLASGRTVVVLTLFAVVLMVGLRVGSRGVALATVVIGMAFALLAMRVYGSNVEQASSASGNPLVTHQVSGLANPLDPEKSTLLGHLDLAADGIRAGFTSPFGHGTAVTNIAASRFGVGSAAKGTEVDVSNAFVSLGLFGGLLFAAIFVITLHRIVISYLVRRDAALLAVLGVLVVATGQWLNGGYYALAPLIWFLVGWATSGDARSPRSS